MISKRELRRLLSGPFYLDGLDHGLATSGTIVTLVDNSPDGILDTAYDPDRFENAYLYLPEQPVAGPYAGRATEEVQRVLEYDPGTGAVLIGRNFAQVPTAGEYYEIHTHGASPVAIDAAIQWACKNVRTEGWFMLGGMIEDGEMQSPAMTAWSVDAGVTAVKVTYADEASVRRVLRVSAPHVAGGAFVVGEPYSIRALGTTDWNAAAGTSGVTYTIGSRFTASTVGAGTGTAYRTGAGVSQTLGVTPDRAMSVFALVRGMGGGEVPAIQVVNVTTGSEILVTWGGSTPVAHSTGSGDVYCPSGVEEEFWGGRFTVPTGCLQVKVRLLGQGDWVGVAVHDSRQQEVRWPGFLTPADQFTLGVGYYTGYGAPSSNGNTVTIPAPIRPEGPSWRVAPASFPGPLAARAAIPIPAASFDEDQYPSHLENYLLAGAFRYISQQMARPTTLDNARFEGLRIKADRDWQAHSMTRNPMTRSRMVWGRR